LILAKLPTLYANSNTLVQIQARAGGQSAMPNVVNIEELRKRKRRLIIKKRQLSQKEKDKINWLWKEILALKDLCDKE